jgi:uncharacterized protein (TIGR03790 family)
LKVSRLLLRTLAALLAFSGCGRADGLNAASLGVIYDLDRAGSRQLAQLYAKQRKVPGANIVGIHMPAVDTVTPDVFTPLRNEVLARLPTSVQSLLLVWSRPYRIGCMSVTTAFAAGYRPAFCEPGCALTTANPLFDSQGWLPADSVGWWPAMLLPDEDLELAGAVVRRGMESDATAPKGTVYLLRTSDSARNVRAAGYQKAESLLAHRVLTMELTVPVVGEVTGAIGYFTGASRVDELARIQFRPGAAADHLTSIGGVLYGRGQMSALAWLQQGATGSYGTVSEPCNHSEKFPNPGVFFDHYLRGETLLEAYWKSVAMPGQGLFIGEPLARPYGSPDVTALKHKRGI